MTDPESFPHLRGKWSDEIIAAAHMTSFGVLHHRDHGYLEDPIPELRRYWTDDAFRADIDAERAAEQAEYEASWQAARERWFGPDNFVAIVRENGGVWAE